MNSINCLSSLIGKSILIDFNTVFFIRLTTKTVNEANIDDNEEYLNISYTTNHVKINNKLN